MSADRVLERLHAIPPDHPLTVIGLGNPDRADDGCGLLIASGIKARFPGRVFLETERSAESLVLDFMEDGQKRAVLFVDASDFGGNPGDCHLFDAGDASRFTSHFSTHKVPISLLMGMLSRKKIPAFLLGIQPETLEFLGEVSATVNRAVRKMTDALLPLF